MRILSTTLIGFGTAAVFALLSIAEAQYLDFPPPSTFQQGTPSPPPHMDQFNQQMGGDMWLGLEPQTPDPYGYDYQPRSSVPSLHPPEYWRERERQIQRDFGIDPESRRRAAERTLDEMNSGWPAINRQRCWFMDKNPAAQQRCFDALR